MASFIVISEAVTVLGKQRSFSVDDTKVDYTSLLGLEDRRRRFSEDVVDPGTKDIVRIQKMFREIQRQVNTNQKVKVTVPIYKDIPP